MIKSKSSKTRASAIQMDQSNYMILSRKIFAWVRGVNDAGAALWSSSPTRQIFKPAKM